MCWIESYSKITKHTWSQVNSQAFSPRVRNSFSAPRRRENALYVVVPIQRYPNAEIFLVRQSYIVLSWSRISFSWMWIPRTSYQILMQLPKPSSTLEATENCNSGVAKLAHTEVNDDWRQATSKWKQTSIDFVTGQCSSNPTQDYFTQWRKLSWRLFREVADHERVWDGHEYQQQARRSSVRRVEAMCW